MGASTTLRTLGRSILNGWLMTLPAQALLAAQSTAAEPLTLDMAMERALAANATVAAARLGRAVDLAALAVAAERPNPEATFEIEKETPKQAIGLTMPIELAGKRDKRIAVGQAAMGVGVAELDATIAQVRNDVRRSYFETLVSEARLNVLRESRDVAARARAAVQTRFDTGDAPRLEVLQADLALNAADTEVTSAAGSLIAARSKLNALLSLPLDAQRLLTTSMEPAGPVVASAALERARAANSELLLLDRRIDEQRAKAALAHALRAPDVAPSATLTHDAQPEFTYGWRAAIGMTVPLFTTHKAGAALEEAALVQLTAQREAALQRMVGEVTAAATSAEAQRQAYLRYRDVILPQARQVEEMAQDSYRLGQTGLAALLQALQGSRDVRLRALDAVAQFQMGLADLERAIGAPLP